MEQYLVITVALFAHDGGAYLAETDAMPPACAEDVEALGHTIDVAVGFNHKGRTVEVALAERTAYLEFLADDVLALGTYDAQTRDASAGATLQRLECLDVAL